MSQRAPVYRWNEYPRGGPLYWMHEASGVLREAVEALLNPGVEPTDAQMRLLQGYVGHWINAPCWLNFSPAIRDIWLQQLGEVKNRRQMWRLLETLMDEGIDPL